MTAFARLRSKQAILHALTFVVALCSFAYELVYAELLTVMYGGSVTQYGLTVGLFFSSLGLGSFLSRRLDHDRAENFLRTELLLAFVAPAGFLLVFALNSVTIPEAVPRVLPATLARLPVVAVGLLSGFELPLLTAMVEREADDLPALGSWTDRLRRGAIAVTDRVLATLFHVSAEPNEHDDYSTVLGFDYLGGLVGSIVYVFVLYPRLGLIPTVFVLGLLNGLAALAFVVRFSDRWGAFGGEARRLVTRERRAVLAACLLLTASYGTVVARHGAVDDAVTEMYLEHTIESEYPSEEVRAEVTATRTTRYQRIVEYERTWTGESANPYFNGTTERCMRLGTAVQLCDSWTDSYHQGLVDVPMSLYDNGTGTDVLLVGGGDWIAMDHLREYGVDVDHVDIDGEFMRYAKNSSWLARYHDGAYRYENRTTHVTDAFAYLGETDRTYDLILLDLPGAKDSDMLSLYSTEFYGRLRTALEPDGVVATWTYSRYGYARHHAAYVNTVRAAGFDYHAPYWAWEDLDGDGSLDRVERFYLLSPDRGPAFAVGQGTPYVRAHAEQYDDVEWRRLPHYDGVEPNSVFDPNYGILVG